jgi:hypothetical protein
MLLQEKGEPDVAFRLRVMLLEDDRIVGLARAAMAHGAIAAAVVIADQVDRVTNP